MALVKSLPLYLLLPVGSSLRMSAQVGHFTDELCTKRAGLPRIVRYAGFGEEDRVDSAKPLQKLGQVEAGSQNTSTVPVMLKFWPKYPSIPSMRALQSLPCN